MRKAKPRNYVTGRWVLTIKTDKQGIFLRAKARWVLRGFQDKQKEYIQTDSPASTRLGFRMCCQMAASKGWDLFSYWSQNSFSSITILWCETWCCVSIATRSRTSSWHCCKIEETCIRHEWCLPTLVEYLWQSTVVMAWFPRGLIDAVTCCAQYSRVSEPKQKNHTQWNDTGNISSKPPVTTEVDAASEKMLDPIAGTPATGKTVVGIIHFSVDDLFGTGGTDMEQRVLARLRKDSKLVQWLAQDKEFVV